jgi:hypothetical protein
VTWTGVKVSDLMTWIDLLPEATHVIENFGSETPSFYDGFTVKY